MTDANLYLGRLAAEHFMGGAMPLRMDLAEATLAGLSEGLGQPTVAIASGILRISTLSMATAVRKVTIERGYDPRDFTMVAFGGAGPLHAVEVAREIGMRRVLIPPKPGHFSAYGMLFADFRYDLTVTVARTLDTVDVDEMNQQFVTLEGEGARSLARIGVPIESLRYIRYAEMRYQRQEYTIKVRLPSHCKDRHELRRLFEENYHRRYGHAAQNMGIDVVMLRVVVDARTVRPQQCLVAARAQAVAVPTRRQIWFEGSGMAPCDVWQRDELVAGQSIAGPAVIEEDASTTVLTPGDLGEIDSWGNIAISLGGQT